VIVATHDKAMVDRMHRRVIELKGGHIVRDERAAGYTREFDALHEGEITANMPSHRTARQR
jgi:cell division transport system ATP-binding protein